MESPLQLTDDAAVDQPYSRILTGKITERQRDRKTREVKLVVRGRSIEGRTAEATVKFSPVGTLFVITVYLV